MVYHSVTVSNYARFHLSIVYLSICVCPSFRQSVCPSVFGNLTVCATSLLLSACVCLSIHPSAYLSIVNSFKFHQSVRVSVRLSLRLSICVSVCSSVRACVRPPNRPSVNKSVRLSLRPSVHLSVETRRFLQHLCSGFTNDTDA